MIWIVIILFFVIYLIYENSYFKVSKVKLYSENISRNYRFIQISDYHLNNFINLNKLKESIRILDPDFIVLTGDIINRDSKNSDIKRLRDFLSIFHTDIYLITGNHEYENRNYKNFDIVMKECGVKTFETEFYEINDEINIYGHNYKNINDEYNLDINHFNILLIHDPLNYIYGNFPAFDLILAGHIHGGQVRLPLLGAIIDHDYNLFPEFSKGIYKNKKSRIYISSGLGSRTILRTFNRVEIVLFDLYKKC